MFSAVKGTALEFNAWLPPEIWEKEALVRLHVPFCMRRTPVSWDLFFFGSAGCSMQHTGFSCCKRTGSLVVAQA